MSGGSRGRSPGINNWWNSRGTPKNPNPFHKGIQSESKPPGPKPPINQYMYIYTYISDGRNANPSTKIQKNSIEQVHIIWYQSLQIIFLWSTKTIQNLSKSVMSWITNIQKSNIYCMNPPAQLALKADASASAAAKSSSSFHQGLPSRELTYPPKKTFILKMIFQTSLRWDP